MLYLTDFVPDDTFMMVISWRVRYTDDTITSHFALFDINRWYHAQMPRQIRYQLGGHCFQWTQSWCCIERSPNSSLILPYTLERYAANWNCFWSFLLALSLIELMDLKNRVQVILLRNSFTYGHYTSYYVVVFTRMRSAEI